MNRLCIYHHNCVDGLMAAAVVHNANPGEFDFYPAKYNEPAPLQDCAHRDVVIVDFSYPRDVMLEICRVAKSVLVLDHHKTAKEALEGLEFPNLTIKFDMERSGAGIAWDHYHPDTARPGLVAMVEDRDLWKFAHEGSRYLHYALTSENMNVPNYGSLLTQEAQDPMFTEYLLNRGRAMSSMFIKQVEALEQESFYAEIDGFIVRTANAPYIFASELAGNMAKDQPFAASYFYDGENEVWSLRSRDNGDGKWEDVSAIAKKFGGGGHKHAAGFKVKRGTFRMSKSGLPEAMAA